MDARRSFFVGTLAIAAALAGCQVGGLRRGDGGVSGADAREIRHCTTTTDTDVDGIYDELESNDDFDGDGTPNAMDTDSDGDGYPDATEHGTTAGCTAADTDADGYFDFVDLDADGDGLSDEEERTRYFTDPLNADSDGDGYTDLAEAATGRDPNDSTSRIPDDAYYVVLPYEGAAVERDLVFGTTVRKADVFFMMDRTGSMTGEVDELKSSLSTIVPQMAESIPDLGVGFGGFAGFGGPAAGTQCETLPIVGEVCTEGEGDPDDTPFHLYSVITTDRAQMVRDIAPLAADQGGATWASSNEALFQAATGAGVAPWVPPQSCTTVPDERGSRYGYPCFRPGALPIMVVMTDTSSKNGPLTAGVDGGTYDPSDFTMGRPRTYTQALTALQGIGARVIGVLSGTEVSNPSPQQQFQTWARETGTVDASGAPILFNINGDGTGLDSSIVEAIRTLAEETPQDISAAIRDGEDRPDGIGPVDAGLFVKAITPVSLFDGSGTLSCPQAGLCDEQRFYGVTPGSTVTFRLRFLNDFQEPRSFAQVFLATVVVLGNGVAELDQHEVIIVVPSGSVPILI